MKLGSLPSYPCWAYGSAGAVLFRSEAEFSAAEGDWYDTPADVPAEAIVTADRQALIAEAEGLGVKVDRRWGDKRLAEAIDVAKG